MNIWMLFLGFCLTILNMFRKSLNNVRHYFNHMRFQYLFFHSYSFICWFHVVTLNKIQGQKIRYDFLYVIRICTSVHDFAKISTLIAFNSYQDFTISSDDSSLSLDGYKLIRSDRSGFCNYYRETLRVKTIQINYPSLDTKPSLWN